MMMLFVCVQAVVVFKAYQEKGQEPDWANLLFWLTVALPTLLMPAWWLYFVCTQSQVSVSYTYTVGGKCHKLRAFSHKQSQDVCVMIFTVTGKCMCIYTGKYTWKHLCA